MKERQPFDRKNTDLKARYEAKPVTPKQIDDYMNGLTKGDFEDLEPLFPPDEHSLKEKGDE